VGIAQLPPVQGFVTHGPFWQKPAMADWGGAVIAITVQTAIAKVKAIRGTVFMGNLCLS
jgi:hypothetical protein